MMVSITGASGKDSGSIAGSFRHEVSTNATSTNRKGERMGEGLKVSPSKRLQEYIIGIGP